MSYKDFFHFEITSKQLLASVSEVSQQIPHDEYTLRQLADL